MPHHVAATMGPHMAICGSDRMLDGSSISPIAVSQCGIGPITGLNSHAQLSPARKVGTAHGRNTSDCAMPRPATISTSVATNNLVYLCASRS